MPRKRTRVLIEDAIGLRLVDLQARGVIEPGKIREDTLTWRTPSGSPRLTVVLSSDVFANGGRLTLRYKPIIGDASVTLEVQLATTRPHFGGLRWWLLCPVSGMRATKLYLFAGRHEFCHRAAMTPLPSYRSQRLTPLRRAMERAAEAERNRALAHKLLGERGGVTPRQYAQLVARATRLRTKEAGLLVERLYSTSKY